MISALAGGRPVVAGATGVTRLTDTDLVVVVLSLGAGPPLPLPPVTTVSVPVLAPGGSPDGFAVTTSVMPEVGSVPDDGETLKYGLSTVAVNDTGCDCPAICTFIFTGAVLPSGVGASICRVVVVAVGIACTTIDTGIEFAPGAPLQ